MPIGGVVITVRLDDVDQAQRRLAELTGVDIHGADKRGNIVAVFDTRTSKEMVQLMERVNASPLVLHTGLTYLNMEDVLVDAATGVPPAHSSTPGSGGEAPHAPPPPGYLGRRHGVSWRGRWECRVVPLVGRYQPSAATRHGPRRKLCRPLHPLRPLLGELSLPLHHHARYPPGPPCRDTVDRS